MTGPADGRSALAPDAEAPPSPPPGGAPADDVLSRDELAAVAAMLKDLLPAALNMAPAAAAKAFADPRFLLDRDELEQGTKIVGATLQLYADDLLKYAKVLALVACVAWTGSVLVPRVPLLVAHLRGTIRRPQPPAKPGSPAPAPAKPGAAEAAEDADETRPL